MFSYCLKVLLTYALLAGMGLSAATLYKVVHKDGSVTYTDRPVEGAVPVDLSAVNSAVMPAIKAPPKAERVKKVERQLPDYQLSISSPSDGQTIRDNSGNLTITAQLTPAGAGEFQLFMDDELIETSPNPVFPLTNLDRGEHRIQVKFKHQSGKILASSPVQVFFLHRISALITPN